MKKWNHNLILFLFVLVMSTSCTKEREFELIIENNTDYVLDNVRLSCAVDERSKNVDKNSSSDTFTLSYKPAFLPLSEPLLCVSITKFSDSQNTYDNTRGRTFSISDLSKNKINVLKVELSSSSSSTGIFDMSIHN